MDYSNIELDRDSMVGTLKYVRNVLGKTASNVDALRYLRAEDVITDEFCDGIFYNLKTAAESLDAVVRDLEFKDTKSQEKQTL